MYARARKNHNKSKKTYTPINDKTPESTTPAALVAGTATPRLAIHIAAPTTCVKVTASSGTNGNAASVPSALAMARFWRDGVGEMGRRAWPPRRSSRERIVARMWERGVIVRGLTEFVEMKEKKRDVDARGYYHLMPWW